MIEMQLSGRPVGRNGEFLFVCKRCGMSHTGTHTQETHYCGVERLAPTPQKDPPACTTLLQKAKNFATAAAKHVAAGMPMADQGEIDRRFAICQQCEHFDGTACSQCGCPVVRQRRFVSKLSWAGESCPVGKWGPASA